MNDTNADNGANNDVQSATQPSLPDAPSALDEIIAEYDTAEARMTSLRQETITCLKRTVFETLRRHGFVRLVVDFDGYGDSGQIERMIAVRDTEEETELPNDTVSFRWPELTPIVAPMDPGQGGSHVSGYRIDSKLTEGPLPAAVETICYELLWTTHGGWENNEGAYGTFTFEVGDDSINLDFNERFIESTYYSHVW